MTTRISYLSGAVDEVYGTLALNYISDTRQKSAINAAASNIGISAGAIAGAMAEEATAYFGREAMDDFLDKYALSGIDPETAAASLAVAVAAGPVGMAAWAAFHAGELESRRTHAEWAADYAKVDGDINPDALDKLSHPVLMDVGAANFKIYTAITLVNQYAHTYPDLGLTPYLNDYAALASDLVNKSRDLTAKLYGLYLKEAEDWYKGKLAYGDQWDSLPQEFKDALMVSYTNIGVKKMEALWENNTDNGAKLYQPQPLLGTGGGMNHLQNAVEIGTAIGLDSYGMTIEVSNANFYDMAKEPGDIGMAYRYALQELRYVALPGLDYSHFNQNGKLNLYDPSTGEGGMTDLYLEDRAAMLTWKLRYDREGKAYDSEYNTSEISGNWDFVDTQTGITLAIDGNGLSLSDHQIVFGSDDPLAPDTLTGSDGRDHLYGMAGGDTLSGGEGSDYLEGGIGDDLLQGDDGNDTLQGGAGDDLYIIEADAGADTLIDSDGQGRIRFEGQSLDQITTQARGRDLWKSEDGRITYLKEKQADGSVTLRISGQSSSVLYIKNYTDGMLGITLEASPEPTSPTTSTTILGDLAPQDFDPATAGIQTRTDAIGNVIVTDTPMPDREDTLYGSTGNDLIRGLGGNDRIYASQGDDDIMGDMAWVATSLEWGITTPSFPTPFIDPKRASRDDRGNQLVFPYHKRAAMNKYRFEGKI